MNINIKKTVIGGVVGTVLMTLVGLFVAPMMGMPPMNPAKMLASAMGDMIALGWMAHFMIGIVLAAGYALVTQYLPGQGWVRGLIYSVAPWLMAQLIVIPMMGMSLFSGAMNVAVGSLVGHLIYGATVGAVYVAPAR
jgi:uncharacterized membrane protein YagU involved in acid resistance